MKSSLVRETPATLFLKKKGLMFSTHVYDYVDHGGTRVSAEALGVDEHCVIKTLVMEDERAKPLVILMHGDCKVSTKLLAKEIGCKKIEPCPPAVAHRHTGYLVGGTSPFGMRKEIPVYIEKSILALPILYINGGSRGLLVSLSPEALVSALSPRPVEVAQAQ